MASSILVYIDQFKGKAFPASWEVVNVAHKWAETSGATVKAVVLSTNSETLGQTAIHYGADEALVSDDPSFADYRPEPIATLLSKLAKDQQPEAIFFSTSTRGRELAAMVAIDLDSGVLPDVITIANENGKLVATRPIYAGKLLATVGWGRKA